jgi:hypothetical protein
VQYPSSPTPVIDSLTLKDRSKKKYIRTMYSLQSCNAKSGSELDIRAVETD